MAYEIVSHILEDYILSEDLARVTNQYNAAQATGHITPALRFEYALSLVRSRYSVDHYRAITLLEDLSVNGDHRAFRDYLYYLTIANIKVQKYERAKQCVEKFLANEPKNRQALDLKAYIDSKVFNDGMKGLAIVGGAAVALGAVVALAFAKK